MLPKGLDQGELNLILRTSNLEEGIMEGIMKEEQAHLAYNIFRLQFECFTSICGFVESIAEGIQKSSKSPKNDTVKETLVILAFNPFFIDLMREKLELNYSVFKVKTDDGFVSVADMFTPKELEEFPLSELYKRIDISIASQKTKESQERVQKCVRCSKSIETNSRNANPSKPPPGWRTVANELYCLKCYNLYERKKNGVV